MNKNKYGEIRLNMKKKTEMQPKWLSKIPNAQMCCIDEESGH